jgi:Flp pilus assembly protein TadG
MRRLIRDDGAIAVVVALTALALFAFGALAIDISRLHQERRDLQNGADAAALALAQSCGQALCDIGDLTALQDLAQQYADGNARDSASNIEEVCGLGAPGLPGCSDPPEDVPGNGYVMVRTRTGTAAKEGIVPPVLAELVAGDEYEGTVRARGIAAWGAPSGVAAQLPLTFSMCELASLTKSDPTDPDSEPVYADPADPDPALEQVIYFHETTNAGTCPAGPSGADLPGGFGWLESTDCEVVVEDGWYGDKTGAAIPNDCKKSNPECKFDEDGNPVDGCLEKYVGSVIRIPVYDLTNGLTGTNGEYRLAAYAAFYMTGYRFPSSTYASPDLGIPCLNKQTCISGYFVESSDGGGQVGNGPSWGLTVYQLVG